MTDESTQTPTTETPSTPAIPYERFKEVNDAKRKLEELVAQYQREQAEINERKLAEQGKHEELIASLKPKAERAEALEASIKTLVADELSAIADEERRGSIADVLANIPEPDKQLLALRKLAQFVTPPNRPTPAPMDGGKGSRTPSTSAPTEEDRAWAARFNVNIDDYMKNKEQ